MSGQCDESVEVACYHVTHTGALKRDACVREAEGNVLDRVGIGWCDHLMKQQKDLSPVPRLSRRHAVTHTRAGQYEHEFLFLLRCIIMHVIANYLTG